MNLRDIISRRVWIKDLNCFGDVIALSFDERKGWDGFVLVIPENGDGKSVERDFNGVIFRRKTGAKDRHGIEIFEGDIVRYKEWITRFIEWMTPLSSVCGFSLSGTEKTLCTCDNEDIEIIGNIYQNPELIDGKI
jgi:hypothetical protein